MRPILWYGRRLNIPFAVKGTFSEDAMKLKQCCCWLWRFWGCFCAARICAIDDSDVAGQVTDRTGATVAGAKVTARNTNTNLTRAVDSNERGEYHIEFLPVGVTSSKLQAWDSRRQCCAALCFKSASTPGLTLTGSRQRKRGPSP